MPRSSSQVAILGLLLVGSVASIVFVVSSFDPAADGRKAPESMWEEPAAYRSRRANDAPRPADPAQPPEARKEPGPAEDPDPEPDSVGEQPVEDRVAMGEMAELTLELMRPKEDEDRRIVITVTDENIAPMEDVLVVVRQGEEMIYRARTDEDGIVEFDPYTDEEGPFRVDAITPYYSPGTETELKPGDHRRIELVVQPWIEGRVRAPSKGQGLVTLWTETGKKTTNVESDGTFAFYGLDPGWYTVRADVDPYGSDEESFSLAAGTREWVELRVKLRKRVRIFGDIEKWSGAGGKVWINGVEAAVSVKGRYIFDKGVIGINEIVIDAPPFALLKARFEIEGRKKSKYDFKLGTAGFIRGLVREAKRSVRVTGAEVRVGIDYNDPQNDDAALFPIGRVPVVLTGPRGEFEIGRLELGTNYLVSIVKHPHGQFLGRFTAQLLGVHRMELPTGPFVWGRLRGLGGIPRGAVVTARRILENPDERQFNVPEWDMTRVRRDNKGHYALSGLLRDVYLVRVDAPGFGSVETVLDLRDGFEGRMDLRIRRGQADRVEDAELLARLPPVIETGEEVEEQERGDSTVLTIDAAREDHQIPFPGVLVRFFEGDMEYSAPMSFTEPTFELVGLPEATYRAVLTHPLLDKPLIIDGIRLVRGEPRTVRLRERKQ